MPKSAQPCHHMLLAREGLRVSRARRLLDVVVVSVALVLLTPVLAVVALLVLVVSGRPVLYRQLRVGEAGVPFELVKFRSMTASTNGPTVTAADDVRITRLGHFLRRTSLDELPQLLHVLSGKMTLVGPRPESAELAARYPPSCRIFLLARPGLTGPAQLAYRERSAVPPAGRDVEDWYLDVLVPLRCDADLEYLTRPTLWRTLGFLWATALFVLGMQDRQRTVTKAGGLSES